MRAQVLWEAGDVLGRETVEQRRLAGAVLADETVTIATLEAHVGLTEEHASSEREDDVLDVERKVLVARIVQDTLGVCRELLLELLDGGLGDGGQGARGQVDVPLDDGAEPLGELADRVLEELDAHHAAARLLEQRGACLGQVGGHLGRDGGREALYLRGEHLGDDLAARVRVVRVARTLLELLLGLDRRVANVG